MLHIYTEITYMQQTLLNWIWTQYHT